MDVIGICEGRKSVVILTLVVGNKEGRIDFKEVSTMAFTIKLVLL
jgi:hypothetical protein